MRAIVILEIPDPPSIAPTTRADYAAGIVDRLSLEAGTTPAGKSFWAERIVVHVTTPGARGVTVRHPEPEQDGATT